MAVSAVETVLCWSVVDGVGQVEFFRGDDHYVFRATKETLAQSLRLPGLCAAEPSLSLTFADAANIAAALRQITPSSPAEVEPAVDEWFGDECISDCAWLLTFCMSVAIGFWVGLGYLIWRVVV